MAELVGEVEGLKNSSPRHHAAYEEKYDGIEDYGEGWDGAIRAVLQIIRGEIK